MGNLGKGYLAVLDKYLLNGYKNLDGVAMTAPQKLRTQIVYEAYQVWLQNKQVKPMELCRRISSRVYEQMLIQSRCNPTVAEFVVQAGITPGRKRSTMELYHDVEAFNHIIGLFTAPTQHIEKAKVLDASDWLIEHGMQTGDGRDVQKGADLKMRLHKDFDEQAQGFEELANTDVNITGDVSVIKHDRVNYSDEQKESFAKRFGISVKEVTTLVENADGVWEPEESEK